MEITQFDQQRERGPFTEPHRPGQRQTCVRVAGRFEHAQQQIPQQGRLAGAGFAHQHHQPVGFLNDHVQHRPR